MKLWSGVSRIFLLFSLCFGSLDLKCLGLTGMDIARFAMELFILLYAMHHNVTLLWLDLYAVLFDINWLQLFLVPNKYQLKTEEKKLQTSWQYKINLIKRKIIWFWLRVKHNVVTRITSRASCPLQSWYVAFWRNVDSNTIFTLCKRNECPNKNGTHEYYIEGQIQDIAHWKITVPCNKNNPDSLSAHTIYISIIDYVGQKRDIWICPKLSIKYVRDKQNFNDFSTKLWKKEDIKSDCMRNIQFKL